MATFISGPFSGNYFAQSTQINSTNKNITISTPYSDDIRWIYREINGKMYKRLFNATTGVWIGDWILVG